MNYFILQPSTRKKDNFGVYPQVQRMTARYDYKSENSIYNLNRYKNSFPEFTPNLNAFLVQKNTQLTDLLSVSVISGGLLLTKKMKLVLESHNLPSHKFYEAHVDFKGKDHQYYWLHIVCDLLDDIDYIKSNFIIYQN